MSREELTKLGAATGTARVAALIGIDPKYIKGGIVLVRVQLTAAQPGSECNAEWRFFEELPRQDPFRNTNLELNESRAASQQRFMIDGLLGFKTRLLFKHLYFCFRRMRTSRLQGRAMGDCPATTAGISAVKACYLCQFRRMPQMPTSAFSSCGHDGALALVRVVPILL